MKTNWKFSLLCSVILTVLLPGYGVASGVHQQPENQPPTVKLIASQEVVTPGQIIRLTANASDPERDTLTYTWKAQRGKVPPGPRQESSVDYVAPDTVGDDYVEVTVNDGHNLETAGVLIRVVEEIPTEPPTVIYTPTDTPALPPTLTYTPAPMDTDTPTSPPPTDTPTKPTIEPPTATPEVPTDTPVPLPPTLVPTDTPVPIPTETPGSPTGERPAPVLLEPEEGLRTSGSSVTLRWKWADTLASDEYFDVQIRPKDKGASVFVDWTKDNEYELSKAKWTTWEPGAYTWTIAIIRGHYEGDQKVLDEDLNLFSEQRPFRWDEGGGDGGGGIRDEPGPIP